MNTFLLIVILSAPAGNVDTVFRQEFPNKAYCMQYMRKAFTQNSKLRGQVKMADCTPLGPNAH